MKNKRNHLACLITVAGAFLSWSFYACCAPLTSGTGGQSGSAPDVMTGLALTPLGNPVKEETDELNAILASGQKNIAMIPRDPAAEEKRRIAADDLNDTLENFVASYPTSAWTPDLRLSLARVAQMRCGYSTAAEHYRKVWDAVRGSTNIVAREIARKAAGGLARMLALTGRLDELDAFKAEVESQSQKILGNVEWRWAMEVEAFSRKHPTDAYKCGLHCVDQLGRMTQSGEFRPQDIVETDSSLNGFTADELVRIGVKAGLHIHAAWASDFSELPIPSIIHLRSDHFVIIKARHGNLYDVFDSTTAGLRRLTAGEISKEATGCVIVSDLVKTPSTASLRPIDANSAATFRGRCHGPEPFDHDDSPDTDCNGCTDCANTDPPPPPDPGMPTYFVSQPFLGLWVTDTPLEYQPGLGPKVSLKLRYTDRRTTGIVSGNGDVFSGIYWYGISFGNTDFEEGYWSCSWCSFAELSLDESTVDLMLPAGGWATFNFPSGSNLSSVNYRHSDILEKVGSPGSITSLILHHTDGSQDTYGLRDNSTSTAYNDSGVFYMTKSADPSGNATSFAYDTSLVNSSGFTFVLLTNVTAADGTTFTIQYSPYSFAPYTNYWVTNVFTSYGSSVSFTYDTTSDPFAYDSELLGITDAAGIQSQIMYEDGMDGFDVNQITNAYGTINLSTSGDLRLIRFGLQQGIFDRTVYVTNFDGSTELYAQLNTYTNTDWPDFAAGQIPSGTPVGTLDTTGRQERNTFYWNAEQFAPYVGVDLTNTTPSGFVWTAFKRCHIQHWLASTDPAYSHFDTLSIDQAPSPDGVTEGQTTWYDYVGKPVGVDDEVGTQMQPSVIARVMPDTSTAYQYFQRNDLSMPTNAVDKWTDGAGDHFRTNVYVYAANEIDLVSQTNAIGVQVISNIYNLNHQVTTNFDALGQKTTYSYDSSTLLLTSMTLPSGLTTSYTYDGNHRLQNAIDSPINRTNSYSWYSSGNLQTSTNYRGLVIVYFWDGLNRLTGTLYPDGTTTTNLYSFGSPLPGGNGTTNILDLTATKDRMGFWTYLNYDSMRRKIAVTNANGTVTLYSYCECGGISAITNAAGTASQAVSQFFYDDRGKRIATQLPDSTIITNVFDSLGRMIIVSDAVGSTTNYYDNLSRVVAVSNAVGLVKSSGYDVLDRVTNSADANDVVVISTYDYLNRPLTRSYPDGGVEHFVYTPNVTQQMTSYTNQLGDAWTYAYDPAGRKTNEIAIAVSTNTFGYDGAGDLLTLSDGNGNTTSWGYDQFGRRTNKVDAAGNVIFIFKYDADNRLTNRWTPVTGSTVYSYDDVGNMTGINYQSSPNISLFYDPMNRMTNMSDAVGTTAFTYDVMGQLLSEKGPWPDNTVSYSYANRLRTSLSLLAPNADAWTQTYSYDAARRLTNVTSPAGAFTYQLGGAAPSSPLVKELLLPNGAYVTNDYDGNARLIGTALQNTGGVNIDVQTYAYNQGNQRTQQVFSAGNFMNYTYDSIGELQTALGEEPGGATNRWQEQLSYTYDAAGNLTQRTNNAFFENFSVNNLNELTAITNNGTLTVAGTTTSPATNVTVNTSNAVLYVDATFASTNQPWINGNNTYTAVARDSYGRLSTNIVNVNLFGTNNFAYDLNGNMLTNNAQTFVYDDENQLIAVWVTNNWMSQFAYDGKFRRRIRKEFTWNGSSWTKTNEVRYIYDGNVVIQERNTNNLPQVTYTRGTDLNGSLEGAGGIGGLLARTVNSSIVNPQLSAFASAFYHCDGNGNITCLIYTNQTIAAKYEYDPYGNILSRIGALADANLYRFSSKECHIASGLIYYLYRYYAPNLQRWINRDPIGERANLNLYDYIANNSVNSIDLWGLIDCAAFKQQIENAFDKFNRDSALLRDFLGNQYDELGDLYWLDRAQDLAFSLTGNQLFKGVNSIRLALTADTLGQGASLGADLVRGGTLTGEGLSANASFQSAGIGGEIGGPIGSRVVSMGLNMTAKRFARNYTTNGVRKQLQDTINELNNDLNAEHQSLLDQIGQYRKCCQ